MHIPSPQSNSVLRSHVRFGAAGGCEGEKEFVNVTRWDEAMQNLTAIQLVTSVPTLSFARALEIAGDARFISTLELIRTTCKILTVGHHFVVAAGTIALTIANPTFMDASDAVLAQIFRSDARLSFLPVTVIYRCAVL